MIITRARRGAEGHTHSRCWYVSHLVGELLRLGHDLLLHHAAAGTVGARGVVSAAPAGRRRRRRTFSLFGARSGGSSLKKADETTKMPSHAGSAPELPAYYHARRRECARSERETLSGPGVVVEW